MGVALYHTPDAGRTWALVCTGKQHIDAVLGRGPRQVRAVGVFHSGSIGPCVHDGRHCEAAVGFHSFHHAARSLFMRK